MPEKVAWQGIAVNGTHSWKSYAHGIVSPEACKELGLERGTLVRDLRAEEFPPELVIVGTNFSVAPGPPGRKGAK